MDTIIYLNKDGILDIQSKATTLPFWLDIEGNIEELDFNKLGLEEENLIKYDLSLIDIGDKYPYQIKEESLILYRNPDTLISLHTYSINGLSEYKTKVEEKPSDYAIHDIQCKIIDLVIDHYFSLMDTISDISDSIEEELVLKQDQNSIQKVYELRKKITQLRKSILSIRNTIHKSSIQFPENKDSLNYEILKEELFSLLDSLEIEKEVLSNMIDIHLSLSSNKSNDVMKLLTIFSTIFIPLSFLTGIYGMNFSFMPELEWIYGYIFFWFISFSVVVGMLWYFKRKKWF